jgi:hypothetical protein
MEKIKLLSLHAEELRYTVPQQGLYVFLRVSRGSHVRSEAASCSLAYKLCCTYCRRDRASQLLERAIPPECGRGPRPRGMLTLNEQYLSFREG